MFGDITGKKCNLTKHYEQTPTTPIVGDIQFYKLNLIVSGSCNIFAFLLVSGLMWYHANRLSNPKEQLDIMRVSILIPCYAVLTLCAVYNVNAWPFVKPWIEVCQGYALANFWILICRFTTRLPSYAEKHDQQNTSADNTNTSSSSPSEPRKEDETRDLFFAPLLALSRKQRRRPLTLNRYCRHWILIMQGPIVTVIVAVCTNIIEPLAYTCKLPNELAIRMLLSCATIVSMVTSMWTAIRHCGTLRSDLWEYRAMFKMLSFKLILGLYIILQVIYMFLDLVKPSPLNPTKYLNEADIEVGVPMMATSCELVLFSVFFCWSFSVSPYILPPASAAPPSSQTRTQSPALSTAETLGGDGGGGSGFDADPEALQGGRRSEQNAKQEQQQQQQQEPLRYQGGFCGLKAILMMYNHKVMFKAFVFPFVYDKQAAAGGYTGQAPRLRKDKWRYMWYYKLNSCWTDRRGKKDADSNENKVEDRASSDSEAGSDQDMAVMVGIAR